MPSSCISTVLLPSWVFAPFRRVSFVRQPVHWVLQVQSDTGGWCVMVLAGRPSVWCAMPCAQDQDTQVPSSVRAFACQLGAPALVPIPYLPSSAGFWQALPSPMHSSCDKALSNVLQSCWLLTNWAAVIAASSCAWRAACAGA